MCHNLSSYFITFHNLSSHFIHFPICSDGFLPRKTSVFPKPPPGHCHVRRHRRQQAPCHVLSVPCGAVTFFTQVAFRRTRAQHGDLQPGPVILKVIYGWYIIYIWLLYMVVIYGLYMAIFLIGFDCYICFPFVSRSFPVGFCMLWLGDRISWHDCLHCLARALHLESSVGSRRHDSPQRDRNSLNPKVSPLGSSNDERCKTHQDTDSSTIRVA